MFVLAAMRIPESVLSVLPFVLTVYSPGAFLFTGTSPDIDELQTLDEQKQPDSSPSPPSVSSKVFENVDTDSNSFFSLNNFQSNSNGTTSIGGEYVHDKVEKVCSNGLHQTSAIMPNAESALIEPALPPIQS